MSAATQKNVPALRFPEFSGEWIIRLIKDLAEVKTGSRDTQNRIQGGKYPFYVRSDTIERINSYAYDGEAILTSGDGVGVGKNIHYVNGKFDYHQRVYAIYKFAKNLSGKFFFHFFKENFLRRVMRLSAKNSVDSVRMSMIADMFIPVPFLPEQKKIASFLSAVDERIERITRKKELLEQYKKGMTQKIFSQEIRFKDDNGNPFPDWEVKTFGEFTKKVSDSHNPLASQNDWKCIELESLGQGNGQVLKVFRAKDLQSIKTKFQVNDVLFGKLRPYLRKYAHVDFNGVCTSEIWVLRARNISDTFLFYIVQTQRFNQYANIQPGLKMPRSDWNIVSASQYTLPPSLREQKKIADFLSSIDDKINLIATELSWAQTFKKGLLQKMFI